uniref:Uncharacterized protein n=1 Tax=Molossus molossus TaxID=27622 RepID=A0A7J8CZE9_MOLMO|nr:hypothetical protein HJG59_009520 [Molossus molossus]
MEDSDQLYFACFLLCEMRELEKVPFQLHYDDAVQILRISRQSQFSRSAHKRTSTPGKERTKNQDINQTTQLSKAQSSDNPQDATSPGFQRETLHLSLTAARYLQSKERKGPSVSSQRIRDLSYSCIVLHCVYVPLLFYPFVYCWTFGLFPDLIYCK